MSDLEILELAGRPLEFGDIPCHTQAVKRVIPMITAASLRTSKIDQREGIVRNVKNSRAKNLIISHKKFFSA